MYELSSSPQSIGGVLDDGFRLFKPCLPKVAVPAFCAVMVGQVMSLVLPAGTPQAVDWRNALISSLISTTVSSWMYGTMIARMDAVAHQTELSLGGALAHAGRRLLPLVLLWILYSVIVTAGLLLLVIPGFILSVSLMFSFFFVLLERENPVQALVSSHRLVWGSWWRTLVIVSVAFVILIAAYVTVFFVIVPFAAQGTDLRGVLLVVQFVLVPAGGAVLAPLLCALTMAAYYDLKLRRSGADLEARLGAAAQT